MENINELKTLLSTPKDIVITTHRNPDGDAIGSSLGLYHFLQNSGLHNVKIVSPSEYPENFDWMPDVKKIVIYDDEPERAKKIIEDSAIIFCLDFNSLDRIDKVGEIIRPLRTPKVMIDHHLFPESFADFILSEPKASSTCELIYDFIEKLNQKNHLDEKIGNCLYTGIITDTGSFKYGTSVKLFRIVAELLDVGVRDYILQDLIFNSMQEKHLRLLGHCLSQRLKILPEYKTGIITLTKEDYQTFEIQRGDTEGIVNFILKLKDVKMAAFIMEQPTIVKISLRSKGNFSVQEIAKKHFRGGGHKNAAGGASFQGLEETLERFEGLLPRYKNVLNAV